MHAEGPAGWHKHFIGAQMQHNYPLYALLDDVLRDNHNLHSIVEIGTGNGALTMVLGLWGVKLGIPVLSIDRNKGRSLGASTCLDKLGVIRLELDEFSPECSSAIKKHIGDKPCLMVCDGGAKAKEVRMWAPQLPQNSIITAHDWTVEVGPADVVGLGMLVPIFESRWLEDDVQMAFWRVN